MPADHFDSEHPFQQFQTGDDGVFIWIIRGVFGLLDPAQSANVRQVAHVDSSRMQRFCQLHRV